MTRSSAVVVATAIVSATVIGGASAVNPTLNAVPTGFSFVPVTGHATLPTSAISAAEHFTFSLLTVREGEDGNGVLRAITPFTTTACALRQSAILHKMGPALVGLYVQITGASQSGTANVSVHFGGSDTMTKDAIYSLVRKYQATMAVGMAHTSSGWRVMSAQIVGAKNGRPACS